MKITLKKGILIFVLIVHVLLFATLAIFGVNGLIDTLVPENLAHYHYYFSYEQLTTAEEAETKLTVLTYRHKESGALISEEEYSALSQKDAENYVLHCGWRYLCTANGIDYCIYSENQGDDLETFVAMRLSDKFLPWQVGTAFAAGALLIVALLYFLGLALLLKKLLAPKEPQSPTPQDE